MISTKQQKELAVQMWEEIGERVADGGEFDVELYKENFCEAYNLTWRCHCVLCNNFMTKDRIGCSESCPLMKKALDKHNGKLPNLACSGCSGTFENDYMIATDEDGEYSIAQRLEAIDNIIQAIREAELEENN